MVQAFSCAPLQSCASAVKSVPQSLRNEGVDYDRHHDGPVETAAAVGSNEAQEIGSSDR